MHRPSAPSQEQCLTLGFREANQETRIQVRVVYMGGESAKPWWESGGEAKPVRGCVRKSLSRWQPAGEPLELVRNTASALLPRGLGVRERTSPTSSLQ